MDDGRLMPQAAAERLEEAADVLARLPPERIGDGILCGRV